MTTSLELSKKLAEAGLKIETEKSWCIPCSKKEPYLVDRIQGGEDPEPPCGCRYYPTHSTDELLAVMPDRIEIERYNFNFYVYISEFRHREKDTELSEALGLMVKWLLENSYHYNPATKMIEE